MMTSLDEVLAKPEPNAPSDKGGALSTTEYRKGISNIISNIEDNRKKEKEIPAAAPPVLQAEPKQQDFTNDPMKSFGTGAMWLATLGPLLTRRPLVNALNASAGVMNSAAAKDAAAYKNAFDTWKANTDNAWKLADWNRQHTKDMQDRFKDDEGALTNEMEAWSKATNDPTLDRMAKMASTNLHLAEYDASMVKLKDAKLFQEMVEDGARVADEKIKLEQGREPTEEEHYNNMLQSHGTALGAWSKGGVKTSGVSEAEYQKWKADPAHIGVAEAYANGVPPQEILRGLGKGAADKMEFIQKLAYELHPDLDISQATIDYASGKKRSLALAGPEVKIRLASNILDESIPSLMEAADKVGLSPSTNINAVYNAVKTRLSDRDFQNFSTQLRAVTTDYANLVGRGSGTVHSDEEALKILNENKGISSLEGFRDAVSAETKNLEKGLERTRSSLKLNPGKPAEPDDTPPISMLQEDHVTTFKDGSKWKLKNGVASKVQ
jgi:hypothetical protein